LALALKTNADGDLLKFRRHVLAHPGHLPPMGFLLAGKPAMVRSSGQGS
jgi:hypothetical protein